MPKRTVLFDEDNNELECYINDKGKAFISIGPKGEDELYHSGYITLNKADVDELVVILSELSKQMEY